MGITFLEEFNMEKFTKQNIKEFLKHKLSTNIAWAVNGLMRIYDNQTAEEKEIEDVNRVNGIGFTGADAEILSGFVRYYHRNNKLTEKQTNILLNKMPKYWEQLLSISDKDKLYSAMNNKQF
jgi:hypothetical protein